MTSDERSAAGPTDAAPAVRAAAGHETSTQCANCGADLLGPWCHACGQRSRDVHHSVKRLLSEWIEGLANLDSRVWATLPDLVLRPARLTSNFLAGRRAPQLPPLRMFLVVVVLLFMAQSMGGWLHPQRPATPVVVYAGSKPETGRDRPGVGLEKLSAAQKAELRAGFKDWSLGLGGQRNEAATAWLQRSLDRILADPKAFNELFMKWAQRLSILMLPIVTGLLALLFLRGKTVMLFDHMIFALHSLSFQGLLLTFVAVVDLFPRSLGDWLLLAAPVHLFAHLHGVYRSPVLVDILRVAVLFLGSLVAFVLLLLGVLLAGVVEIGAA